MFGFGPYAARLLIAGSALAPLLVAYLVAKRNVSVRALRACGTWLGVVTFALMACTMVCFILDRWQLARLFAMYFACFAAASNWLRDRYKLTLSDPTSLNVSGRDSAKP